MSYSSEVLADSPGVYYKFDETSGTTAADSSGNGRDATIANVTLNQGSLLADASGSSFKWTADSNTVTLASASWMNTAVGFSMDCLVYADSLSGAENCIASRDSAGGASAHQQFALYVQANGSILLVLGRNNAGDNGAAGISAAGVITTGVTYHVALTWDLTTAKVYVNGTAVISAAYSGAMSTTTTYPLTVGRIFGNAATTWAWKGRIDEFAYYPTVLSSTRVSAHYNAAVSMGGSTGTASATLPALTGSVSGTGTAPLSTGTLSGTLPSLSALASGIVGVDPWFTTQPTSIVVLGDSTGDDSGEWLKLVTDRIGNVYPSAVVNYRTYNTGSTSYNAASTVHTGGGSTTTVYNGHVGATAADYPTVVGGRLAAMVPVDPDVVILNYGHNHLTETPSTFEGKLDSTIAAIQALYPSTPIIISSQNPQFPPTANPVQHNTRQGHLATYAASHGYGYIPIFETFQAQVSPSSFIESDGVHPTQTGPGDGSHLWAGVARSFLFVADAFAVTVAASLPPLTATATGTHTSNDQAGAVAATLPALTGAVAGTVTVPPVEGSVDATLPPLSATASGQSIVTGTVAAVLPSLTGRASDDDGNRDGTTLAVLPRLSGDVVAYVPTTSLDPWTADLDGRTGLTLLTPDVELTYTPPLELPPAGIRERVIQRVSRTVPALHTISGVRLDPVTGAPVVPQPVWNDLPVVTEDLGTIHTTISAGTSGMNEDVTYYRGGITHIVEDTMEEPFGDKSATFRFPQITSLDEEPTGPTHPLWWQTNRANIKIVLKRPDGTKEVLWSGLMVSDDTGNEGGSPVKSRDAIGALWQASYDVRQVPNYLEPTDTGTLIAKALNDVASRNYPAITAVATGIPSRDRGSWAQSALSYVQGLLAKATDDDGRQWTVAKVRNTRWTYVIRRKTETPSWTVTNGAHGVKVSLSRDITQGRNVVFGRWVAPNGYAGMNTKYPGMTRDASPLYTGTLMGLGATDASANGGVTLWQRRARELGYTIDIDGTISSGDVQTIRAVQRRYGLSVDGVIGPQTWAATFGIGSNVGDLKAVIRLPLAADPRTQRWLFNADGSRAGLNPAYDPDVMVVSDDVDFGPGITRAEATKSAQQIVNRESTPSLSGTIELTTDPREGSRLMIPAGDKITLIGYEHHDRVLHIARRTRSWDRPDLPVTLEVDERSRDALTVAEIRAARRESMRDPARQPGNSNRRSANDVDQVVPFDGESSAGIIPKMALYGGLWSVIRIPVSETGRVAKMRLKAGSPFAIAFFGAPITPAHLVSYVGNPLASDAPFEPHEKELDAHGFIEGFGQKGKRCGYYPGAEDRSTGFTGVEEQGGFEYSSSKPPWVWVAMYAASSCFIEGNIYPAPVI